MHTHQPLLQGLELGSGVVRHGRRRRRRRFHWCGAIRRRGRGRDDVHRTSGGSGSTVPLGLWRARHQHRQVICVTAEMQQQTSHKTGLQYHADRCEAATLVPAHEGCARSFPSAAVWSQCGGLVLTAAGHRMVCSDLAQQVGLPKSFEGLARCPQSASVALGAPPDAASSLPASSMSLRESRCAARPGQQDWVCCTCAGSVNNHLSRPRLVTASVSDCTRRPALTKRQPSSESGSRESQTPDHTRSANCGVQKAHMCDPAPSHGSQASTCTTSPAISRRPAFSCIRLRCSSRRRRRPAAGMLATWGDTQNYRNQGRTGDGRRGHEGDLLKVVALQHAGAVAVEEPRRQTQRVAIACGKHKKIGFMSTTRLLHEGCFSYLCRNTPHVKFAEQIQLLFRLSVHSSSSLRTVIDMSSAHAGIPEL